MENNFDDIIELVLNNSAIRISGPYGSGKSSILNQIKEFFLNKNYEVNFCYGEPNDTLISFFNRITAPTININNNGRNFELQLNRLLEIISENQKNGFVMIIDELEFWFGGANYKQIDSICSFIQFLAEFAIKHNDVFLIIASKDKIPIERNFLKNRIHEIQLSNKKSFL